MKRKAIIPLLLLLFAVPVLAQLSGDGYYRVQNFKTKRYISIIDNKSQGVNVTSTRYDVNAIVTIPGFDRAVSDPSTVMYIEKGSGGYVLRSQSTDSYVITGRYLTITSAGGGTYQASGVYAGQTIVLADEAGADDEPFGYLQVNGSGAFRNWSILPVNQADNQYFGLPAEVTVGSQRYTSFFASFPYTFQSSGMKSYVVTKVDGDMAVWQELTGTVPSGTAVIVLCAGATPNDNRLNLVNSTTSAAPTNNLLKGVYFDNMEPKLGEFHYNYLAYDANTMRVLGVTSKGKLGFVKFTGSIVPRNRAYLAVPAGSPDEITLVTQSEYDAEKAKDDVVVTANSYSRVYGEANPTFGYTSAGHDLQGTPTLTCSATATSPVGVYDIVVSRGSVTNKELTMVNGKLTVTQAPLTITAQSYTIKQNEPLPQFAVNYSGLKNAETESVLTAKPVITSNVPADKAPGTYTITVSGASATNYNISYVAGTLTILEADPITITANSQTMEYGGNVPALTYTVSGGTLTGTPVLTCEATATTDVGSYAITVAKGSVDYPNLKFVDGTLTVTKAPITVTAQNRTIAETDALPSFTASYEGFKNGQTESVLTVAPAFACAPEAALIEFATFKPGEYAIAPSGAEAKNYTFIYINGVLKVNEVPTLTITAADAQMVYGDEVPALAYTTTGGTLPEGAPAVTTSAKKTSSVGEYDVVVARGTLTYPRLQFVNGKLTITKAPLTVSVGNYEREAGQENPVFELKYEGWRNNDDESVLIAKPVATTEATADSPVGEYAIVVSGGEAQNYTLSYVNGNLTVKELNAIVGLTFERPVDVYTTTGRKVRSQVKTLENLPRGIYIVNGRKVIVR